MYIENLFPRQRARYQQAREPARPLDMKTGNEEILAPVYVCVIYYSIYKRCLGEQQQRVLVCLRDYLAAADSDRLHKQQYSQ